MPARGQGQSGVAQILDCVVAIATDPQGYKQRVAEFDERQEAADKAEAAARVRIEEADRRKAELDERETELDARQPFVDEALSFKKHCQEMAREIDAERLEQEKTT